VDEWCDCHGHVAYIHGRVPIKHHQHLNERIVELSKLTWTLRTITVCCALLPLLFTVVAYRGNLIGLLVPPEVTAAMAGNGQALQDLLPDVSTLDDVEPTLNDDFYFNPDDGTFGFSLNVTSPVDTPVTVDSFSVTVTDENGTLLGTIQLGNSVTLAPGENATIPIEGAVSPELIALLQDSGIDLTDPEFNLTDVENMDVDIPNIRLTDVNLNVGGVQIHIDELNPNELFGSQESSSTEEP
jgi:hypothetical protein